MSAAFDDKCYCVPNGPACWLVSSYPPAKQGLQGGLLSLSGVSSKVLAKPVHPSSWKGPAEVVCVHALCV